MTDKIDPTGGGPGRDREISAETAAMIRATAACVRACADSLVEAANELDFALMEMAADSVIESAKVVRFGARMEQGKSLDPEVLFKVLRS